MGDTNLLLSPHDFQQLMLVRKGIETKFNVVISMPDVTTVNLSVDLIVVGFAGTQESLANAVKFVNTYVFSGKNISFTYPQPLMVIFADENWRNLLEKLHDVIIANKEDQKTLLIFGSGAKAALSALKLLATRTKKNKRKTNCSVKAYSDSVVELFQPPTAVPEVLKMSILQAAHNLPPFAVFTLMMWVKKLYKNTNPGNLSDGVTLLNKVPDEADQSVIIVDAPCEKKEIPVITLSDDDDDDSIGFDASNCCASVPSSSSGMKQQCHERADILVSASQKSTECGSNHCCVLPMGACVRKKGRQDTLNQKKQKLLNHEIPHLDKEENCIAQVVPDLISGSMLPCRLRPIVIDAEDVAKEHGRPRKVFSCEGIEICIEYFIKRGHSDVIAFLPRSQWWHTQADPVSRKKFQKLEKDQKIIFTPSRCVNGKGIRSRHDRA